MFFVTNRCNCRCSHCFYWRSLNAKGLLSLGEIKKIADSLGNLEQLYLSGGEPFLRQDLSQICDYFIEHCKTKIINLPTNGTLKKQAVDFARKFHDKVDLRIFISLDGLGKTHDKIRGTKCFYKAIETLDELREIKEEENLKFNLSAIITVSRNNLDEIPRLCSFLVNHLGVKYSLTPLRGSPKDSKFIAPTPKDWTELFKKLERIEEGEHKIYRKGKNLIKLVYSKIAKGAKQGMYLDALRGKRNFICEAGRKVGVLDYNGNISLCELTRPVGNLRDYNYDFYKVWNGSEAEKMRKEIKRCVCTHACFISPKLIGRLNWLYQSLS